MRGGALAVTETCEGAGLREVGFARRRRARHTVACPAPTCATINRRPTGIPTDYLRLTWHRGIVRDSTDLRLRPTGRARIHIAMKSL